MFKRVSEESISALQDRLNLQIHEAEETPKLAA
jgi:hypothetical protein